jgi:hypothetical protein
MRNLPRKLACAFLLACTALSSAAIAEEWIVDRLRGELLVQQGGRWTALARGDTVNDRETIRTGDEARVVLTRGNQSIEIDGASELVIHEREAGQMTTVQQQYGTVTIEAERREVQHFSVVTPFLAAIVKGTRFTVQSGDDESTVEVLRGLVQVQDNVHSVATDVAPGQSAVVGEMTVLEVSGAGRTLPLVTMQGEVITPAQEELIRQGSSVAEALEAIPTPQGGNGNGKSGQGNSGNSGQGNNGNGNSDQGKSGNGNGGNSGQGNSGSNGNSGQGNNGNGNGNSGQGHSGNNGNSGQGNNDNGNGNSGQGNSGNNGNSGQGGNGNGNGNSGNSGEGNSGNNGNGNGNGRKS